MDWDGVGTFALFMASGAVGLGIVFLKAYKERLKAGIEKERIRAMGSDESELLDEVRVLRGQMVRLEERAEFTDRLLQGKTSTPEATDSGADNA